MSLGGHLRHSSTEAAKGWVVRRLKVVVADDHGLMVEAIKIALERRPEFEIVGVAESGSQVLPVVLQAGPDLVVLDLRMPGMDGLACISLLRERMPSVRIAVLSAVDSDETAEEALSLGASTFISKASTRWSCRMRSWRHSEGR